MLPGSPSSKVRWSWPKDSAIWSQSSGNIRRGGSRKAIVSRWRLSARRLPVRRKNGTPSQRQLSTKALSATKVSVSESGATPVLLAVAGVLAADDVLGSQRRHRVEDLLALEPERLRLERGRRLHRDEAEHLEEVGDDHVAEGAGFLVEAAAHLDRERLRDVDLDVVDVVAVPDRLEHAVGEAQREQVLHRLAAEVVVDPEDAALLEDRVQRAR